MGSWALPAWAEPFDENPPSQMPAAHQALDEAYSLKAMGNLSDAVLAFEKALEAGAAPQLVALELGFIAATQGDAEKARSYFHDAAAGEDATLAAHAKRELSALAPEAAVFPNETASVGMPGLDYVEEPFRIPATARPWSWSADVYADAYGWQRRKGHEVADDVVFTVRLRALYRLLENADLDAYLVGQGTRDLASTSRGDRGVPVIYADNHAMLGGGLLLRAWERRIGFFAQAGPVAKLVDDGRDTEDVEVRAGAFLGVESSQCSKKPHVTAFIAWPCAELYSEAVYVNRYDNNLIAFTRVRTGLSYFAAHPLLSQFVIEVRGGVDKNQDFFNNFVDGGLGHRFRFVEPLRFDVMLGAHGGTYLGVEGRDPAPDPLYYVEMRLQAATYLEF